MPQFDGKNITIPSTNADLLHELFHENSKLGRYSETLPPEEVRSRMVQFHESLPFEGYPLVPLPKPLPRLPLSLTEALTTRMSIRGFTSTALSLEHIATLLHYAYGVTKANAGLTRPRPFRVVPSGGALYPLEVFFFSSLAPDLVTGLYHYNPSRNHLRQLKQGDLMYAISSGMVQPELAERASLIVFITAIFERSIFKYGDRGYRFIFLEAGHVAQNINLVSTALGLGSVNIGGFFDREVDEFLDLDGITHSTIYMIAIGGHAGAD